MTSIPPLGLALILTAVTHLAALPSHAAVLLDEPFEDTNYSRRGWYDSNGGTLTAAEHSPGSNRALECRFLEGGQKCVGGTPGRVLIPDTESVYVSYWIKHSPNWLGSGKPYHPHQFYLLTNQSGSWDGLAWTPLTTYIEANGGIPLLGIQDGKNIDLAKVGQNLTGVTENRAVAGCNGDSDGYGNGSCYSCGPPDYCNWKQWKVGQVFFSDSSGPYYKSDWHKVEALIHLNTVANGRAMRDGILRYWYDGNLILDLNNVVVRTTQYPSMKFNQFIFSPWIGDGSPVEQSFWIDDLVVSTERPVPATLMPPTNLRFLP